MTRSPSTWVGIGQTCGCVRVYPQSFLEAAPRRSVVFYPSTLSPHLASFPLSLLCSARSPSHLSHPGARGVSEQWYLVSPTLSRNCLWGWKRSSGGKLRVLLWSGSLLGVPLLAVLLATHQDSGTFLLHILVVSVVVLQENHLR